MAKKPDWVSIRADYEIENLGIRDLERKYSVSSSTIATRMKKEEWQRLITKDEKQNLEIETMRQEFKDYINVDIDKLKTIRDIFAYQADQRKISYITIKDTNRGVREKAALDTIEQLTGFELIRQFQVGGFRIDGYDSVNKIAYEIDEKQHNSKKHSQHDALRQKFIEEQLGCIFKRIKV